MRGRSYLTPLPTRVGTPCNKARLAKLATLTRPTTDSTHSSHPAIEWTVAYAETGVCRCQLSEARPLRCRMAGPRAVWRDRTVGQGEHLVLLALLLALALGRLGADLLVVLLEGGEVLAGLWRWASGTGEQQRVARARDSEVRNTWGRAPRRTRPPPCPRRRTGGRRRAWRT